MVTRKLRTLLSLVVLAAAGLITGRPCDAADVSSSGVSELTQLQRAIMVLQRQLVEVKNDVTEEFAILAKLEIRIRDGIDLEGVPRELEESAIRIKAMDDRLSQLDQRASAIGAKLAKIRDDAVRRRDQQLVRAVDFTLGQLAHLQTDIKTTRDEVAFARDTVQRLRDMLG